MLPCRIVRGGEYLHVFKGWKTNRNGYQGHTINIYTGGHKGMI